MKKNLFFLLALVLGAMVSFTSCGSDDPCKDVECGANGTCFDGDGTCSCNEGYEGTKCEFTYAVKFVGDYGGKDVCTSTNPALAGTFNIKDTEPVKVFETAADQIRVDNIGGWENSFSTKITRKTTEAATGTEFVIDFTDTDKRVFKGAGTYDSSTKTLSGTYKLTFEDGDVVDFFYV
jgi:hypothetical protein